MYRQLLISTIQDNQLQPFYPPHKLDQVVENLRNAPDRIRELMNEWSVGLEVATDMLKLSLYDVVIYVDDSGSIRYTESEDRLGELKRVLTLITSATTKFDQNGVSIRFMNSHEQSDHVRSVSDVDALLSRVQFSGLTPLGTNLKYKVLEPLVVSPVRANRLEKPVLVIIITDGRPAGEDQKAVANAVEYVVDEVSRSQYGRGAIAFQFCQVGSDVQARQFLSELDEDPKVGSLVDCTSSKFLISHSPNSVF